jgi:hypothetical protein
VVCDANGNITQVSELKLAFPYVALEQTQFGYDALNRLGTVQGSRRTAAGVAVTMLRTHRYDGQGRLDAMPLRQYCQAHPIPPRALV